MLAVVRSVSTFANQTMKTSFLRVHYKKFSNNKAAYLTSFLFKFKSFSLEPLSCLYNSAVTLERFHTYSLKHKQKFLYVRIISIVCCVSSYPRETRHLQKATGDSSRGDISFRRLQSFFLLR